jgi:hypothetical protein
VKNAAKYKSKQEAMTKVLAYSLFVEKGIAAVERMYSQYISFVLSNKGKSTTQIKNELLHSAVAH